MMPARRGRAARRRWACAIGIAAGIAGCDRAPAPAAHADDSPYTFELTARDDRGAPLSGVRVVLAGTERGATDAGGRFAMELHAPDGARAALAVRCPDGYAAADVPDAVVFRPVRALNGGRAPIRVDVVCPRAQRIVALVVRAQHAGRDRGGVEDLPVVVDGQVRARTGPGGIAHVALDRAPGAAVRVALDTSAAPALRPRSPERIVAVGDRDDVYVIDQTFKRERSRRRRARRAVAPSEPRPEPPKPRRPVKVQ
ncbi:MAG: hypothetical protein D6689_22080 [Deltaproteobacteria bacterium]|nr:MAG: hypothetical protein D6689_22080 [Deltaproteobacteria bacterium]